MNDLFAVDENALNLARSKLDHRSLYFYSRMPQAATHLAQIQRVVGGRYLTARKETQDFITRHYPELTAVQYKQKLKWLYPEYWRFRGADIVVAGSAYGDELAKHQGQKALAFHGTYMALGAKELAQFSHFSLLCLIGPRMQQMLNRYHDTYPLMGKVVGYLPFAGFPSKTAAHRAQWCELLGLDPNKPVLLYTPTHKTFSSWDFVAEQLIDELSRDFNLILRPHPNQALTSRMHHRAGYSQMQVRANGQGSVIIDLCTYPLSDLLAIADLMITDANSPAEESLYYDVPQLFIETPRLGKTGLQDLLKQKGVHPLDIEQTLTIFECGERFDTQGRDNLSKRVQLALTNAELYRAKRQQYADWVFGSHRDKYAAERVAIALADLPYR